MLASSGIYIQLNCASATLTTYAIKGRILNRFCVDVLKF